MNHTDFNRRRFLVSALTFTGVAAAGTLTPAVLQSSQAWAAGGAASPADNATLVKVARLLYPHDSLPDDVYHQALNHALAYVADSAQFSQLVTHAQIQLDAMQDKPFLALDEQAQIAALQSVQGEAFFGAILSAVTVALYMHPAVWNLIGYEGPSYMHGGYLHRGAGVIDWLERA
ncbi:hypothetical protein R50073_42640 [Maricurvus nonylphenolicus]|uniref:hypothetical protein n=1 Tax=Maricurvus nonylphenolicus TaxID=1008307 RepID=UPI0036F1F175